MSLAVPIAGSVAANYGLSGLMNRRSQFWRNVEKVQSQVTGNPYISSKPAPVVRGPMGPRRYARRSRNNRRRRRRLYRRIPRAVQPFSIVRELKSVTKSSLNPAAGGAIATTRLFLNAGADPTGDAGSGKGLGWAQYTPLYQKACTIGWKVFIEICSTDNTNAMMVGFTPMVSGTALTDAVHYKEMPHTRSVIITPDIDKSAISARGSVRKFFLPRGAKMLSDDTLAHAVASNPTRVLHGHIWAQAMDSGADAATIYLTITVTQTVVFFQPETPARST